MIPSISFGRGGIRLGFGTTIAERTLITDAISGVGKDAPEEVKRAQRAGFLRGVVVTAAVGGLVAFAINHGK